MIAALRRGSAVVEIRHAGVDEQQRPDRKLFLDEYFYQVFEVVGIPDSEGRDSERPAGRTRLVASLIRTVTASSRFQTTPAWTVIAAAPFSMTTIQFSRQKSIVIAFPTGNTPR